MGSFIHVVRAVNTVAVTYIKQEAKAMRLAAKRLAIRVASSLCAQDLLGCMAASILRIKQKEGTLLSRGSTKIISVKKAKYN